MATCMQCCNMQDIKSVGNFYTWNNKQQGYARVYCKLDRVLSNQAWLDLYPSAEACFQNEGDFDHTPVVISVYEEGSKGRSPFKYFTMWRLSPNFEECVRRAWSVDVQGTKMFRLVNKLMNVKKALKDLNREGFMEI